MSIIVKPYTFSSGALILASEHNSNFDTIYSDFNGNITNANISASAAIATTKLSGTIAPANGGTGVANNSASTITITGSFALGITLSAGTAITLPTSGTLLASGGALGTPSSGTLTNCTGLPIAGLVASTSTAIGVGSIELGAASDTTIARVSAGVISVEGATVGMLSTAQTWTATQTQKQIVFTNNAITASSNAATIPITFRLNTVTNDSANAMTITMTTTSAVDGQMSIVRILDFSGVTKAITWVNTENSTIIAPTTSNGSTTLFLTVGFIYNGGTSKWRCIASA